MPMNLTQKILSRHVVRGELVAGKEIAIRIDQTLTQDATGTMASLQFEALGCDAVKTERSVSYVDHNTLQMGFRNADDHRYLQSVANKYGIVFSPPGTGICHQLHLENFARPGRTLVGSDSHTPTAGGVGSLAIGAGGLSVALAMAGEPYMLAMPKVVNVHLTGKLQGWAAAKDVILHLLGLLTVKGGVGKVMEYTGPGVATLSVPERATITNMGAELGATTSLFPSDERTREFFAAMGREDEWEALVADEGAEYDEVIEIDLSTLEPLAACPHMPDRVVPVRELAGLKVDQVAIGSCTNSSYADLKMVSMLLKDKLVSTGTDLLIAPGSKQVLSMLVAEGALTPLILAGARLLECACGPCIGMGGSPNSAGVSARTFNRNFEGRSGTQDGQVYLVSPQTAVMLALRGEFTDPASWGTPPALPQLPDEVPSIRHLFIFPAENAKDLSISRGPNIVPLEQFTKLPEQLEIAVQLVLEDDITTDHIMPAGPQITALRSNVPAISEYVFSRTDSGFVSRMKEAGQGVIVAGENYGQGSSREHAALAPRHLGVKAVLAKSFARIHRANLVNFGILPLMFESKEDHAEIQLGDVLSIPCSQIVPGGSCSVLKNGSEQIKVMNDLTEKELDIIQSGGLLNYVRQSIER
ncbi:aconitate hydratase [Desulfobaculum bizertense]|nr:aconitate hydratase [Desulfobaculum bizertense]